MKQLLLWALLLCPLLAYTQDFNNYRLLKNSGAIPDVFTSSSTEKYRSEIIRMEKELKARERKDQKQFYLESNFAIDDLLLSGKVLFGTELNRYVEKVAEKVLEQVPELKGKVQFYIFRSSAVNAFATQQGVIFINMGLLAQLENEAQLAFIIAHELSHVKRNHGLNKFLEKKNIDRSISRNQLFRQTDFDEALVAKSRYSKELEFEADNDGLDIYLKTNYSLAEIDGVFDVLRYSHLLFDIEEFDKNFFNIGTVILPEAYFMDTLSAIKAIDDEDDTKSTHPATAKRLARIQKMLEGKNDADRKAYLVSETDFAKARKVARFELVYYYLHYFRYEDAIYTTYLLLKEYPESEFLQKSVTQALHGMSKHLNTEAKEKEDKEYKKTNSVYQEIEGPQQQVYYLTTQLKNREMTILALRQAWAVHEKFPNNKEVKTLLEDLFIELAFHYEDLNKFKKASLEEVKDIASGKVLTTDTVETQKEAPKLESKYDKIKSQQVEQAKKPNFDFAVYSFGDVIDNQKFKEHFEAGKKEHDRLEKRRKYYASEEGKKAWKKELRARRKMGLGIDSIIVLNPYYLTMDTRKNYPYKYIESEVGQKKFNLEISKAAQKLGMHCVMLDAESLSTNSVDTFNDIHTLNEWFSQQSRLGDVFAPGFSQEQVDSIIEKYGTPHVLKTGMVVLREKKSLLWMIVGGYFGYGAVGSISFSISVINPAIGIPISALALGGLTYALFKPKYETLYFSILYDLRTQRYEVIQYKVKKNNGNNNMSSFMKKTLSKISKK